MSWGSEDVWEMVLGRTFQVVFFVWAIDDVDGNLFYLKIVSVVKIYYTHCLPSLMKDLLPQRQRMEFTEHLVLGGWSSVSSQAAVGENKGTFVKEDDMLIERGRSCHVGKSWWEQNVF